MCQFLFRIIMKAEMGDRPCNIAPIGNALRAFRNGSVFNPRC